MRNGTSRRPTERRRLVLDPGKRVHLPRAVSPTIYLQEGTKSMTDINNLLTVHELADRYGVSVYAIRQWAYTRRYKGFPRPVAYGLWDKHATDAWWEVNKAKVVRRSLRSSKDPV